MTLMSVGADLGDAVRRAQAGDAGAYGRVVEACWADLVRFARSVVGEAEAEDVVQESLVAGWQALGQLRSPERFRAWMLASVFRRGLRRQRWQRLRRALDELADRTAPDDPAAGLDVDALLSRLPPRQRAVMHLTAVEGMTDAEIAETLSMAAGSVRAHRRRARARLARLLGGAKP